MGVSELWTGAIGDSLYQEKTGVLKMQEQFAKDDVCEGKNLLFTIILDKGYRIVRIAWRAGKQECLQPQFASSDRRFTTGEVLLTASIAADRFGNERGVRVCKMS